MPAPRLPSKPARAGRSETDLETLRRLHSRHEVHYAALDLPQPGGGLSRAGEYCTKAYPVPHGRPSKSGPRYWAELATAPWNGMPLAMRRYRSQLLRRQVEKLHSRRKIRCRRLRFPGLSGEYPGAELGAAVPAQCGVDDLEAARRTRSQPVAAGLLSRPV